MKEFYKKTPLFIFAALFLIAASLFYFEYSKINSYNQKTEESKIILENETARRNEIIQLNNSIESIKDDKVSLETHFAQSSDVVPFLDTVEALGPKVGAKVETTSVEILKDGSALNVRLNVTGSFKSIYKYMQLLENSPYELEFTSFDMQKNASSETVTPPPPIQNVAPNEPAQPAPAPVIQRESKWTATFGLKLLTFTI